MEPPLKWDGCSFVYQQSVVVLIGCLLRGRDAKGQTLQQGTAARARRSAAGAAKGQHYLSAVRGAIPLKPTTPSVILPLLFLRCFKQPSLLSRQAIPTHNRTSSSKSLFCNRFSSSNFNNNNFSNNNSSNNNFSSNNYFHWAATRQCLPCHPPPSSLCLPRRKVHWHLLPLVPPPTLKLSLIVKIRFHSVLPRSSTA